MLDPFAVEIIDLHRFLDAWLKGQTDRGNGEPGRAHRQRPLAPARRRALRMAASPGNAPAETG